MDIGWKVTSTVAPMLASVVATKVLATVWGKATGHQPPADVEEPGVSVREVVIFALVSGALIGVARQLALQGASRWYGGPGSQAARQKIAGKTD